MIRLFHADKAGYLKQEGIKAEFIMLGSGPAVLSAVVSKSADIGFSAVVPGVFARANQQPIKMFMALATESGEANHQGTWIAVKGSSPVRGLKDLQGKTVAINASGALCELLMRDHLGKAGVAWDSVKKVVLPFPQMQAALETGNADAACMIEPYFAAARTAPNVKARSLAAGMIAGMDPKVQLAQDGIFVREDWGNANKGVLRKLVRAVGRATADFKGNPTMYRDQMIEEFKLKPEVANLIAIYFDFDEVVPKSNNLDPLISAMQRHGLLSNSFKSSDLVMSLD